MYDVCECTCAYAWLCVCVRIRMCVCVCVCVCVHVPTRVRQYSNYNYTHMRTHTCIIIILAYMSHCVHAYTCTCMCVRGRVCLYISLSSYLLTQQGPWLYNTKNTCNGITLDHKCIVYLAAAYSMQCIHKEKKLEKGCKLRPTYMYVHVLLIPIL